MAVLTPFGQFLAGNSQLHRLDARIKLLILTCYLTALFLVQSWLGLACMLILLLLAYRGARIPLILAVKGLYPLLIIIVFIVLANGFGFGSPSLATNYSLLPSWFGLTGDSQELVFIPIFSGFGFKPSGLLRGLFLALRIIGLFSATSLLTYTTSLVALSDAIVALLRPLAVFRVPTEDIAMVFSIILRFIPLTASEAERIMVAQQARGAVFNKGGPIKRARAWQPVLIPLFVKLFQRSDRLAAAMEARCYQGRGRTYLNRRKLQAASVCWGLIAAVAIVTAGVLL
jgi:energy-coupling factor transport system permease protein